MKIWTLYLVLPGRYGRCYRVSALLFYSCLFSFGWWKIFWVSTGLFFAAMLAYLPAVHAYILGITRTAVAELAQFIGLYRATVRHIRTHGATGLASTSDLPGSG